jgi:hypothetical protein
MSFEKSDPGRAMATDIDDANAQEHARQSATLQEILRNLHTANGPRMSDQALHDLSQSGLGVEAPGRDAETIDPVAESTIKKAGMAMPESTLARVALAMAIEHRGYSQVVEASRGVWAGSKPITRDGVSYVPQELPKVGSLKIGRANLVEEGVTSDGATVATDTAAVSAVTDPDPMRYRDLGEPGYSGRDPNALERDADAAGHRRGTYNGRASAHEKAAQKSGIIGRVYHGGAATAAQAQAQSEGAKAEALRKQATQARQAEAQGGGVSL